MKRSRQSIFIQIFKYSVAFICVVLLLLWMMQTVLLQNLYQWVKIREVKQVSELVEKNIENENIKTLISRLGIERNMCIHITDQLGRSIYDIDITGECIIHHTSSGMMDMLYQSAKKNNGEYKERFERSAFCDTEYNEEDYAGSAPKKDEGMKERVVYVKIFHTENGNEYTLFLDSGISPSEATVKTIRVELLWVSILLVIFSVGVAVYMAKKISRPIENINKNARKLAEGDYTVEFDETGCREIEDLSDTLNYTGKELNKTRTLQRELFANVSHDLRTPLTMITGYSEMMRDIEGENTPQNIQVIIDEARRLNDLVNDMLDLSRLTAGESILVKKDFSLTDAIAGVVNRYRKMMSEYTIEFIYNENICVFADEGKILQVLYNILNNAINYTTDRVTIVQKVEKNYVTVSIIDNGKGIKKEDMAYIFDRYYKSDKRYARAKIGSGLGLSIVKSICELHGMEYGVYSEENKGSCFYFKIKIR